MKLKAPGAFVIVETVYEGTLESSILKLVVHDRDKEYIGEFYGIVVSVGPDSRHRFDLKEGDKVYFRRHEGTVVECNDKKYLSLKDRWVEGKMNSCN